MMLKAQGVVLGLALAVGPAWASKPSRVAQRRICETRESCAPHCIGAKANQEKVREAILQLGYQEPSSMVDPALAIQGELRELGCQPAGEKDLRKASLNCGIVFRGEKSERLLLPEATGRSGGGRAGWR